MRVSVGRVLILLLLLAFPAGASAQKVSFEANAPKVVAVGEVFRIEYVSDSKPQDFSGPQFEGVDVLAGPTLSTSKSVSLVNGNMTQESRYTYTYVLQCNSEGEYRIPAATVTVKGKSYTAGPLTVSAITENSPAAQDNSLSGPRPSLAPDDIVIQALTDRKEVYKGEPVKVTYKLYRRVPLNLESAKFPSYNGFWAQQLNVDGYTPQREELNGKIYDTHVIREDLLFPQQAGVLTVDPLELNVAAQIVIEGRRQSIIDDFFGGPDIQEIRRKIATNPISITVKDLPAGAPSSFSGAVGDFHMETVNPPAEVAANSAFTFGIKISGSGNLPQVQAPMLTLPSSFEQYNVKTTESLNNTSGGIYGYRQFEYPVIARAGGDYEVQPVEFTYFNPKLRTYETLATPAQTIRVRPDSTGISAPLTAVGGGLSKEDIKILGSDIRFIELGSPRLRRKTDLFFGSVWYFLCIAAMGAAFVSLYLWLRKLARERRNSVIVKGKRANKVALQRFKAAAAYRDDGNQRGFYEETLKALWGYIGDKLNIPAANLTKENVREELLKRGVAADAAQRYIDVISECEYAQYAPSATGRMNEIYGEAVEMVSRLENIIGK